MKLPLPKLPDATSAKDREQTIYGAKCCSIVFAAIDYVKDILFSVTT